MRKPSPPRSLASAARAHLTTRSKPALICCSRSSLAAKDVAGDEAGPRRQIAETVFDSFSPQLDLSFAAAVYGLVGLFLGSLIGELLAAALLPRDCLAGWHLLKVV